MKHQLSRILGYIRHGNMGRYRPYTMTSWDMLAFLKEETERIVRQGVEGAFIECGVWRGGNLLLMRDVVTKHGEDVNRIYGFDTFAGMTEPKEMDTKISTGESAIVKWKASKVETHNEWCFSPIEDVKRIVPDVNLIRGDVLQTIPEQLPGAIALLRIDVDWYELTKHVLVHALPRMSKGGCIIFDDYHSWKGARRAVDELVDPKEIHQAYGCVAYHRT